MGSQVAVMTRRRVGTIPAETGRMKLIGLVGLGGVVAISLAGCAADGDVEDGRDDVFLTDDAKADAFGVEDWSPDGAAVLKLVSTATQSKLDGDVGLSEKVAKAIIKKRTELGGKFTDLADLDAAPYVGKTVFDQLLRYVAEHHLFKTALRVPLIVESSDTEKKTAITSYNTAAHSADLPGFARYTFVDEDTKFDEKMASYNDRLAALAMKANITIDGEMMMYAYSYEDFSVGTQHICYIGDGNQVADVMGAQAGIMVGEMYSIWAWRHKAKKFMEDEGEDQYGDDFAHYDTHSNDVLVIYTNDDDGTHIASDVIKRCR